jgi:hypothetical protein
MAMLNRHSGSDAGAAVVSLTELVEPTVARPLRRRGDPTAGALLLVVGAIAVLAARTLLAPGVHGDAAPAPWPTPPPVGSCVILDLNEVARVPCDSPHSGEVVATWRAGEQPRPLLGAAPRRPLVTVSVTRQLPVTPSDDLCTGWVEQYTGWTQFAISHGGIGEWIAPKPLVAPKLVVAPAGQGTADWHWSACVVQTQQPLYTGIVRSAASRSARLPGQILICLNRGVASSEFVACDEPHSVELIGVMSLSGRMMAADTIAVDRSTADVHQLCVDMVAARAGTANPTHNGQLEVVTESVWVQRETPTVVWPPGWLVPDCLIRVVGGGKLVGSVVGLGDRPLPWQN